MFKSVRWRSDKNKIKHVFKLQFHATQLPKFGGEALMISVIPVDVGKPSAKLERVKVRDGSCYWEKPVYETVKFVQEPKTGKIQEQLYHFVVTNGSSKFGFVGEVSVDFANYIESTKISSLSLPLKNAKSEAILHVSIQRMQDSFDQSEAGESESSKLGYKDGSLREKFNDGDIDESNTISHAEDGSSNDAISHVPEQNDVRFASYGSDITLSGSESSYGLDTPREPMVQNNHNGFMSLTRKPAPNSSTTIFEEHQKSQWEWSEGSSGPDVSTDDSSLSPNEETLLKEIREEDSLKNKILILGRQVEVSELELQTLRKQVVKENKKGQDLLKELAIVKEERDTFKDECKKLRAPPKRDSKALVGGGNQLALIEELREELNYEKEINSNLRLQLQKTQESNAELILAVRDLDEILEKSCSDASKFSNPERFKKIELQFDTEDDEEQKALEDLVKEHNGEKDVHVLEQKINDLRGEIELYRRDKDELETQMEQLALDYEILKQENHDMSYKLEQNTLQEQLKFQYECLTSYATVNELEGQIESLENELKLRLAKIIELENWVEYLEEELGKQSCTYESDLEIITRAKIEQEKRAITAEEDLRKTKRRNADAAERLQEEFRKFSVQMASTFDANEKLALKAMNEVSGLRVEKCNLEEMVAKAKEELQALEDCYEGKSVELANQVKLRTTQLEKMQENHKMVVEKLTAEKDALEVDLEKLKESVLESQMMLEREISKRNELENVIATTKAEAEKVKNELNILNAIKEEKETVIGQMKSEVEILKSHCDKLKGSLLADEFKNEELKNQICQLKADLKQEDEVNNFEKVNDNSRRTTVLDLSVSNSRNTESAGVASGSEDVANLKERVKTPKVAIDADHVTSRIISEELSTAEFYGAAMKSDNAYDVEGLSKELASVKEKNRWMECELKEMQERYSRISLKFAEVEGERQQLVMTLRNLKNSRK